MRILADRHHADLLYSLQLLFEDRLGYELFVPVGLNWWLDGYWRFGESYGDDRLARQFLAIGERYREMANGVFLTFDPCHPSRPIYGAALSTAKEMQWDVILASVQENQAGFRRFADETGAKYVYHVGNARQWVDWTSDPLVLDSTGMIGDWDKAHGHTPKMVHISQEFDADGVFRFREPIQRDRITSFVNLLPQIPESWRPFEGLRTALPSFGFGSFGHECPDGFLSPAAAIAEEMAWSGWGYHDKPTGDGFGHVINAWAAVGRPLIGHGRFYGGQRASAFWRDMETCVDLDKHDLSEAVELIKSVSADPGRHAGMCRAIRETFERHYDPEADAEAVRSLLACSSSGRMSATGG